LYTHLVHLPAGHRALHSFPARRSSDLPSWGGVRCSASRMRPVASSMRTTLLWRPVSSAIKANRVRRPPPSTVSHTSRTIRSNPRSEEHTSELQSRENLVCRLLLEKKKK